MYLLIAIILILIIAVLLIVLFIPVVDFNTLKTDTQIVDQAAQLYGVQKRNFTTSTLKTQMIISTLGDSSLVDSYDLKYAIQSLPDSYQVGDIYVLNYMSSQDIPIIIDNSFEVFLSAARMIYERNIQATLMFSLIAFGSKDFYVISTKEVTDLGSTQIYPWTPLQYNSILQSIGPTRKYGYFSSANY